VTATDEARLIAGRYRLISEVGRGAMGVVWLAQDERLGRTVAVKELRPGVGLSGTQVQHTYLRARREARIAGSLQHPHAVALYDVVEHDERPYLVMEYVPSRSLAEVLAERTVIDPAEASEIGAQLASALVAAHKAGIVHRDVKPGNILVTEAGDVKLTDFGISRAAGDVTVTATGEMLGTPAYVAPEVAQGHPASAASDVFSLGATLYAAVEGEPPFGTGPSAIALLLRIVNDEMRPPDRIGPLTDALLWMLRNNPADRPSMDEARQSLAAIAGAVPRDAGTVQIPASAPEPEVADAPAEPVEAAPVSEAASDADSGDRAAAAGVAAVEQSPPSGPGTGARSDSSSTADPRRRLLLPWWAWLVVVAVLVAGIIAAIVASSSPSGSKTTPSAAATSTRTTQSTAKASSGAGAGAGKSTASSTAQASPSATVSATPSSAPSTTSSASVSAQLTTMITNYYKLVPGDLNQAWNYMTADYQTNHAGGMSGYRSFWDQIQSVSLSDLVAQPPSTVIVTINYVYLNGQTVQERTSYGLVMSDGIWKIASSQVLSHSSQ